ncbi:cupin [Reyranella sp.]|jgi:uncharacterized protein YjlB|uniref:cupin n=1 Tax=Reyranella sp. TaxID=1929291 RepID=UPI002F931417
MPTMEKAERMEELVCRCEPEIFLLRDDGRTPNNPVFPLLLYRAAVVFPQELDPAEVLEKIFAGNGWGSGWRNGIFDFLHFHTQAHEVLGIARGEARVQFGGKTGRVIKVAAGDVVVLPAGTGHQRIGPARDLLVVGAYPPGGKYDQPQPGSVDGRAARDRIARVPMPATDPVYGATGPLAAHWHRAAGASVDS